MIDVGTLYQAKLRNFGVSSGDSKFSSDFLLAFNMVVNDLTTLLDQEIVQAVNLDDVLDINQQHFNTFIEGLDHYLTSQFEWTHQSKKDSFSFYQRSLKSSQTAAMQESVKYGRLGNHKYPIMLYPAADQNIYLHMHGAQNGPIEPVPFG